MRSANNRCNVQIMKLKLARLIMAVIPLLALLVYINRALIINLTVEFPECYFHNTTGYLCPACGNTRSIVCLLSGKIIKSIQYNITPLLLLIIAFLYYIELIAYASGTSVTSGKRITIFPRSYTFLGITLGLLIMYYLLRNFIHCLTIS